MSCIWALEGRESVLSDYPISPTKSAAEAGSILIIGGMGLVWFGLVFYEWDINTNQMFSHPFR